MSREIDRVEQLIKTIKVDFLTTKFKITIAAHPTHGHAGLMVMEVLLIRSEKDMTRTRAVVELSPSTSNHEIIKIVFLSCKQLILKELEQGFTVDGMKLVN